MPRQRRLAVRVRRHPKGPGKSTDVVRRPVLLRVWRGPCEPPPVVMDHERRLMFSRTPGRMRKLLRNVRGTGVSFSVGALWAPWGNGGESLRFRLPPLGRAMGGMWRGVPALHGQGRRLTYRQVTPCRKNPETASAPSAPSMRPHAGCRTPGIRAPRVRGGAARRALGMTNQRPCTRVISTSRYLPRRTAAARTTGLAVRVT